jgi:hypothetical protein
LEESSKEGYSSKRAILPMRMMMMTTMTCYTRLCGIYLLTLFENHGICCENLVKQEDYTVGHQVIFVFNKTVTSPFISCSVIFLQTPGNGVE